MIVTIVVLIILATISINVIFGENGLIAKSQQSKELHELEKEKERLELVKTQVVTDVSSLGKVTVDNYVAELIKENITVDSDVLDNGDGSKTVITDTGYSVTILPKGDRDVEIIIDGKADKLPPKIVMIDVSTTQTGFTAKADIRYINGGRVEYFYRTHGQTQEDEYKSITDITEEGVKVTGLISGQSYDIKVIATNENGSDEKVEIVTTTKVLIDEIKLNETETVKEGANITLTAIVLPNDATNKELEWASSNTSIATVDDTGKVTGQATGQVTITVKAKDGSNKGTSCTVIVIPKTVADMKGEDVLGETKIVKDEKENQVVVPKGFKVANDSGTSVQEGIVIEDSEGNQFVWVPVSNINHNGSNKIRLNNNSEVEITLGRYTFNETSGAEIKAQYGSEYTATVNIQQYYQELTTFREANQTDYNTGKNATAKNLKGFIESVRDNHGYYIARYEASYGSGTTFGVGNDSSYYKPLSKISTANSSTKMNYTKGTLWNYITQGNASKVSRQMYYGNINVGVESDLCNSYAWDTAIVYIQAMGHNNYANKKTEVSTKNTGTTGDEKCHIFDMAANCIEWTTEYSTYNLSPYAYPCLLRGGNYLGNAYSTGSRFRVQANKSFTTGSFRPILYVQ